MKNTPNRREFLKSTVSATALGLGASATTMAQESPDDHRKEVRISETDTQDVSYTLAVNTTDVGKMSTADSSTDIFVYESDGYSEIVGIANGDYEDFWFSNDGTITAVKARKYGNLVVEITSGSVNTSSPETNVQVEATDTGGSNELMPYSFTAAGFISEGSNLESHDSTDGGTASGKIYPENYDYWWGSGEITEATLTCGTATMFASPVRALPEVTNLAIFRRCYFDGSLSETHANT
jgi:hypothetical protein